MATQDELLEALSPADVKALLADTQESLATAFARMEAYRLNNKMLRDELAVLRRKVHGPGPEEATTDDVARMTFPQHTDLGPTYTAVNNGPVYVSEVLGQHPVDIIKGGKRTPANLIVTRDFIDLVETRAHIQSSEFVGITGVKSPTVPPDAPSTSGRYGGEPVGTWQFIWTKGGATQRLAFQAGADTRKSLHKHTERWLGATDEPDGEDAVPGLCGDVVPPRAMLPSDATLELLGDESDLAASLLGSSDVNARALASVVPPLERLRPWAMQYSTKAHGTSLSTLYRKCGATTPTLTLVRDNAGYVFGCYSADGWRVSPRFYGSGQTFVFQLEPHRVTYPWRSLSNVKNDFFLYATPDCLAVGGLGHFAMHLDGELLQGSSGTCDTFGSPCLAGGDEFRCAHVEVWQVAAVQT